MRYPVALLYAFAAVLVRVTALFFIAPILIYTWVAARQWKTRALIFLESAAASLVAGFFLLPDWQTARWNLFDSHLRHWAGAAVSTEIYRILTQRLPDITQNFGLVLLLFAASIYFIFRHEETKNWLSDRLPISICALALALFAASHLANGLWETEYLAPAVTAFLPILAIVLSQVYQELESQARVFAQGTMIAALLLFPLNESVQHIDFTGRRLPLAEIDQVADFVAQNSRPTDKVLALEAFAVVVDANRTALPGTTLAQFSIQLVDATTARQLHVVNTGMIVEAVNQEMPEAVLLTDRDWNLIRTTNAADADALQRALDQKYRLALTVPQFGGFSDTVSVYLKR